MLPEDIEQEGKCDKRREIVFSYRFVETQSEKLNRSEKKSKERTIYFGITTEK